MTPREFTLDVQRERGRQDKLYGEKNKGNTLSDWSAILGEEFGEVCKAIYENDIPNLQEELVQVAAVCQAIAERIKQGRYY